MRRNSYAMTVSLKLVPKCNKGLHVATATDNLYHDIQRQRPSLIGIIWLWCGSE